MFRVVFNFASQNIERYTTHLHCTLRLDYSESKFNFETVRWIGGEGSCCQVDNVYLIFRTHMAEGENKLTPVHVMLYNRVI